jgi:hypothetical protein
MRLFPCLLVLLAAATVARAQEQEQKLMDRIMKPNTSLQATEQSRAFYQGKSGAQDKTASTKTFYSPSHVQLKDYNAKSFYDGHGYWNGTYKYETKQANTSPKFLGIFPLLKHYETKSMDTKVANEASRNYVTREYDTRTYDTRTFETRDYRGRETEASTKGGLSIDQVRELLNKNK